MKLKNSAQVFKRIKSAKKIALFAHRNPDPDALGSLFAMKEICKILGVEADIFSLKNAELSLNKIFPFEELKSDFVAKDYDLIVFLDMSLLKRVEICFHEELKKAKHVLIIDHHETENETISGDVYCLPNAAATCEILASLMMEENIEITPKIATYLWAGLVGDTGRFLHSNVSVHVMQIALKLLESGADMQLVHNAMFRNVTMKTLILKKEYINRIRLIEDGQAGYVVFTLRDYKKFGVTKEEVKSFIGLMSEIEGVKVSFLIYQISKDRFKVSIRTNGANALKLANRFGGGGHIQACAFEVQASAKQCKKEVSTWAKEVLSGN